MRPSMRSRSRTPTRRNRSTAAETRTVTTVAVRVLRYSLPMEQTTEAVKSLWNTLATVGPKVVLFLAILVVGWIVAKFVGGLVGKLLSRVGFDRLLDRGGLGTALRGSGSSIAGKVTYLAVLLLVLQLAFGVFGPNPVSGLLTSVIAFLPRIVVAVALIVVAAAIASSIKGLISNAIGGLSYGSTVANVASWFIIGLGVIAALGQVGVALTVTLPVLVAVLATVGGVVVVGVGGGLIKPMQDRWERYLSSAEAERNAVGTVTEELPVQPEAVVETR